MNDSVPVDNAPQASAASLAAERYVTLTTYKRDGTPVATPVWIAARPDGALCFTTDPQSWKVKRLQRNPQVTVQACGLRGQVREGTAPRAATAEAVTPPPVVKPGKEKIVGKWQFSFEGEPKAKIEEEAKKKFAKEKDTKKFDAFMKQHEEEAAGEWIEFSADTYTSHVTDKGKDKVVLEVKYEIVKDDNTTLVTKAGKDKPNVGKILRRELREQEKKLAA